MEFKQNTKALIGGASGGIGEAVARELASNGVQVCVAARTEDKLKKVVSELPGEGHSYFVVDMSNKDSVSNLANFLKSSGPYQIFVNNSGGPKGGALLEAEDQTFEEAFRAHVLSAQEILRVLHPQMKDSGWGRLVNIISTSVRIPIPNLGASNTIRGAVASWSKTLSMELGKDNITVNNVLPGYTETSRLHNLVEATSTRLGKTVDEVHTMWKAKVPMARFAKPEEVAAAVCFLASEQASYISGVSLPVDGGRTGSI